MSCKKRYDVSGIKLADARVNRKNSQRAIDCCKNSALKPRNESWILICVMIRQESCARMTLESCQCVPVHCTSLREAEVLSLSARNSTELFDHEDFEVVQAHVLLTPFKL